MPCAAGIRQILTTVRKGPPRDARGSDEGTEARGREATPPASGRARCPRPGPLSTPQPHSPHRCVRGPHRAVYYGGGHLRPWKGQDWPRSGSLTCLSCHTPRLRRLLPRSAPTTHSKPIKFSILFTPTPLCRQPRSPPPLNLCPLALSLLCLGKEEDLKEFGRPAPPRPAQGRPAT